MSALLPPLLIGLAGLSLVAVVTALWSSLRLLFSGGGEQAAPSAVAATERDALLEQKRALLQSIRDLEFERDVGKLSARDFARLDGQTRARAREVLRALDEEVGPHRERAEALLKEALAEEDDADAANAAKGADAGEAPATSGGEAPAVTAGASAEGDETDGTTRLRCESCEADNEPDAVFCKKCGARLSPEGAG